MSHDTFDCGEIVAAALSVLHEPGPAKKAQLTQKIAALWRSDRLQEYTALREGRVLSDRPARDTKVRLVQPRDMPKLGRGGTLASRRALLHSLVHTESIAIDLAWDIIARFGPDPQYNFLGKAFFDDFVQVAEDEARHFRLLEDRLHELGCCYGDLPAHDGLWSSAHETAHSLPARLVVEHCVHEGRGLDVLPQTISRFQKNGDAETASILQNVVFQEEVQHCAAGVRWLLHLYDTMPWPQCCGHDSASATKPMPLSRDSNSGTNSCNLHLGTNGGGQQQVLECKGAGLDVPDCSKHKHRAGRPCDTFPSVEAWFHWLVRKYFTGNLKPPFNTEARAAAGFTEAWYAPLAVDGSRPAAT